MNKKGFTLIELLAVIVILAVVSLIAIPLITNVIDSAKKGAIKDSAYGIIESANVYLAKNIQNGMKETKIFICSKNKCVSGDEEITFKGKVEAGTLILTPMGKSIVCVDDGENYALKLETETKVSGSSGTCGEYEEENGAFTILSDVDTLNKQIVELQQKLNEKYQEGYDAGYSAGDSDGYIRGTSEPKNGIVSVSYGGYTDTNYIYIPIYVNGQQVLTAHYGIYNYRVYVSGSTNVSVNVD